jgi:hypothetical protein
MSLKVLTTLGPSSMSEGIIRTLTGEGPAGDFEHSLISGIS